MPLNSSIYSGSVMHNRRLPRKHRFKYRVWWMLVDIDELAQIDSSLRLFSYNRFNLFSIHDSDYGYGAEPLRTYVERRLAEARLPHAGARIDLLTMPRLCGYAFNPLSIYFCRNATGRLAAIIYEVHNTFGERHSYSVEVAEDQSKTVRHAAGKAFYVSPFMDMLQDYAFRVRPPDETISVSITSSQHGEAVLHTALYGSRMPLTSAALMRRCVSHPLLTLKVICAIHWEAMRIWRKGIRIRPRNPVTGHAATFGYPAAPVQGDND